MKNNVKENQFAGWDKAVAKFRRMRMESKATWLIRNNMTGRYLEQSFLSYGEAKLYISKHNLTEVYDITEAKYE